MENQCLGLAEAIGVSPVIKRIVLRTPWKLLSPHLRLGLRHAVAHGGLAPPWPDLVIASGRQSVPASLAVKQGSGGRAFRVHIQDPVIDPRHFDLVVVPEHDRLRGANVLTTRGSLHMVTAARLADAAARFADRLTHLPRPRVAVLIGGANAVFRLDSGMMERIADQLAAVATHDGAGLMVTPSRRTGAGNEAILRQRLDGLPAEVWDGAGENPYFGYLALADAIIATGDSVNMVCEAAATGKPVHVIDLEGGSRKFRAFHRSMAEAGVTRPFAGRLEHWTYEPVDEPRRVAEEVRRRLAEPPDRVPADRGVVI